MTTTLGTSRLRGGLWPYGLALLVCALTALLRFALLPVMGLEAPLLLFIMPVVLSAWYGGAGPGLLATAISALLGSYLFIAPAYTTAIIHLADVARLAIFLSEGVLISALSELRRRSQRQARSAALALGQSEERFQLLVDGVTDYAIFMLDPSGVVTSWNTGAARIKGYETDSIIGQHFSRFYPPEDIARGLPETALRSAAELGRYEEEGWRLRRDGSRFRAHTILTALRDEAGVLRGFAKVTRDITDRVASEQRLRSSEARLAGIVESAMDAIITVDADQRIVLFNHAAETMFGYTAEEALGRPLADLLPAYAREAHQRHIRRFGATGVTTRSMHAESPLLGLRRDQRTFPIEASISHIIVDGQSLYTAIVRDISARKELEAQFLQSQKMEVVGRLAGGIAHDFNNLLTVIQGYSAFIYDELPPDSPWADDLQQVLGAAQRAGALTRQLLAFARQQPLNPQVVAVNELVNNLMRLLGRTLGSDIRVVTELAPEPLQVRGDPGQLEQVLVNLCVNARDAMPEGGVLTIGTAPVGRETVRLTVRDTGVGMGPEVQRHLFEPFFSTKPPGHGTGLGLSTSYAIVRQHGGSLRCTSAPRRGSLFTVDLPRLSAAEAELAEAEVGGLELPGGSETILLAEDEPAVRSLAARVLRLCGYTVLEAEDGAEALEVAAGHSPGRIDLLLSDMVMPNLGGPALAAQLQGRLPGLRALLMSANPTQGVSPADLGEPSLPLLQKPFTAVELAQAVRRTLDLTGAQGRERAAGEGP